MHAAYMKSFLGSYTAFYNKVSLTKSKTATINDY